MGVDIPHAAVESIVKAQEQWNKRYTSRSTKENLKKRNLQKRQRKARYEREGHDSELEMLLRSTFREKLRTSHRHLIWISC
jgi:uncharacterized protein YaiI (UPF0178 family)